MQRNMDEMVLIDKQLQHGVGIMSADQNNQRMLLESPGESPAAGGES